MRPEKKMYSQSTVAFDIFKISRGLLRDILIDFYLTGRREHDFTYGQESAEDCADAWLKANQDKYTRQEN